MLSAPVELKFEMVKVKVEVVAARWSQAESRAQTDCSHRPRRRSALALLLLRVVDVKLNC